jgi:hypothetical protein
MINFLVRLIIGLAVTAGIVFLITGGNPDKLPKPSEEGFQFEFDDSYSVDTVKTKVKDFFSNSSSTVSEKTDDLINKTEKDVSFFKDLFNAKESQSNESVENKENDSSTEVVEDEDKSFIEKISENLKKQINKITNKEEEVEDAFSNEEAKETNIPTFTTACFPDSKQVCYSDKCVKDSPKVEFTLLDKEKSVIAHCNADGCITYESNYEERGDYENYQPKKPEGYIITKSKEVDENGRSEYMEIVTGGIKTTLYSGYCLNRSSSLD